MTSVAGPHFSLYTKRKKKLLNIDKVEEFNTTFGVAMSKKATTRVPAAGLRYELIREEFEELGTAIDQLDIVEIADALGDIIYVTYGAVLVFGIKDTFVNRKRTFDLLYGSVRREILDDLHHAILFNDLETLIDILDGISSACHELAEALGIDLSAVIDAIHRSNMSKLGEDGKPIYRESDNKVLKGPNYKTPTDDIRKLVFGDNYAPTGD